MFDECVKFCKKKGSKPDNRGMMSECRFDGVVETMEFKNLTDQVAQVAQGLHS